MDLMFTLQKNGERFSDLKHVNNKLEQQSTVIKDGNLLRPTGASLFSFIEMPDILFTFARTLRAGDWEGQLCATRNMLPWSFAYDNPNYSRFGRSIQQICWISSELSQASMQSLCKPFDLFCVLKLQVNFNLLIVLAMTC